MGFFSLLFFSSSSFLSVGSIKYRFLCAVRITCRIVCVRSGVRAHPVVQCTHPADGAHRPSRCTGVSDGIRRHCIARARARVYIVQLRRRMCTAARKQICDGTNIYRPYKLLFQNVLYYYFSFISIRIALPTFSAASNTREYMCMYTCLYTRYYRTLLKTSYTYSRWK